MSAVQNGSDELKRSITNVEPTNDRTRDSNGFQMVSDKNEVQFQTADVSPNGQSNLLSTNYNAHSRTSRRNGKNGSKLSRKSKKSQSKTPYDPSQSYYTQASLVNRQSPRPKQTRHQAGIGNNVIKEQFLQKLGAQAPSLKMFPQTLGSRYDSHQYYPTIRQSIPEYPKKAIDGSVSLGSDGYGRTIQVGDLPDGSQSLDKLEPSNLVIALKPAMKINSTMTSPNGHIKNPSTFQNPGKRNSMAAMRDSLAQMSIQSGKSMSQNHTQQMLNKQMSSITMSVIKSIQGQSPSNKFQARLFEKNKEQERLVVENRVKKIELEDKKAEKMLRQTLRTVRIAEQVHKRKQDDLDFKKQWLQEKSQAQESMRMINIKHREERKNNISHQRQKIIMENIISRDKQIQDMNQLNDQYNKEATDKFLEMSQRTATLYRSKKAAQHRQMDQFQNHLLEVRNSCNHRAMESIQMSEAHENKIKQLEEREKQIIDNLQMTMKHNSFLMQDLSKKSEALTNTLIPRNPIAPKNKKYPTHSEFGYSMKDQNVKKRYDELYNSKITGNGQSPILEGSVMSKRKRNDARKSMNSVNGTVSNPNSTMQDLHKRAHIPFHQKRATMGPLASENMNRTLDNGPFQDSISNDAKQIDFTRTMHKSMNSSQTKAYNH